MPQVPSLSQTLRRQARARKPTDREKKSARKRMDELKLKLLRIQEGLWHSKGRAIVAIEGFDAAGKGGVIRELTESLDPRSFRVHPIGPPTALEQGTHWLYRFWARLPQPGQLAIFDRTWYGRVLVERVDELTPRKAWLRAYREIREFEAMLTADGVDLIKIFLAVSPEEQLKRFKERMENPYKRWKLTLADVHAREKWDEYVQAADDLLRKCESRTARWHVIPSDHKPLAQEQVLRQVVERFSHHGEWIESQRDARLDAREIERALRRLSAVK